MRAFLSAAVLCLLSSPALATIAISTAAISVPAITLAGVSVSSGVVAGTLGALSLLGAVKGGALLAAAKQRGRRAATQSSIDADNVLFISILKLEEEKCVRRFVCEVATGHLNAPEYNSVISALLEANLELEVDSPKFVYSEAVKSGSRHQSVEQCQLKYSCPKTGSDIYTAMKQIGA